MPIVDPATGVATFTISDLGNEVILKVENRKSDLPRAYVWLKEALLELSSNTQLRDDFVELERTGPLYNLTANLQEYDESVFLPEGDVNDATLDFRLWIDPPNNTRWIQLTPGHYQRTDASNVGPSRPTKWYRFGTLIGFSSIPDDDYQVQARYLVQHPIDEQNLANTTVLLSKDWNDVLVLAAAERGFIELMEYEKAQALHTLIYGDPADPAKPGMIASRKKKRQREAFRVSGSLRPVKIRRYSWGR